MKLRLPHKFQAALMAALASVSFTTLSTGTLTAAAGAALLAGQQAQADEVLTVTFSQNGTTSWTATDTSTYHLDADEWKLTKDDGTTVGLKSAPEGQLRPDTNVHNSAGWKISFDITNNGTDPLSLTSVTFHSFMFNGNNGYQSDGQNFNFNITLDAGDDNTTTLVDKNITSNGSYNPPTGVVTVDFKDAITLSGNDTKTITLTIDTPTTGAKGCFVGLTSLSVNGRLDVPVAEWAGTLTDNLWSSATAWKGGTGQKTGSDATFGAEVYNVVVVDTAVTAGAVTVSGQDYTFSLSGSNASLAASTLTVESGLSITGTGTVTAGSLSLDSGSGVNVDDGASLIISGTLDNFSGKVTGGGALHLNLNTNAEAAGDGRIILAEGSNIKDIYIDSGIFAINTNGAAPTSNLRGANLHLNNQTFVVRNGAGAGTFGSGDTVMLTGNNTLRVYGSVGGTTVLATDFIQEGSNTATLQHTDGGTITLSGTITLDQWKSAAGTTVFTGNVTLNHLYGGGGNTTLGNGNATTIGQLRLSEQGVGNLTVDTGAVLNITGSENGQSTGASILLAHWGQASTLTLNGGTIHAEQADVNLSWDGTGTFTATSGTARVKGIDGLANGGNRRGTFNLGAADSGSATVVLGSTGLKDMGGNVVLNLGQGTLGASDNWSLSTSGGTAVNANFIGTGTGTTIDTSTYTITFNNGTTGSGNMTVAGSTGGKLVLNGGGDRTGATTVLNGATLEVHNANALGSGDIQVNSGGTLALASTLTTAGTLTFASGSTLDLSHYSGTISTTPTTVASATGGITGFDEGMYIAPTAPKGMEAAVTLNNNEIQVSYTVKEGSTMHLYILTGQSNSLGSVKGNPAPADLFAQYASGGLLYNGNMHKGGQRYVTDPDWKVVDVQPKGEGDGSYAVTGPEYVFERLMIEKGWFSDTPDTDSIGVIKASLDGGGDEYWVKGQSGGNYAVILDTVTKGYQEAVALGYDSVTIDGLLYLQGESNTHGGAAVQTNYTTFLSNLEADLKAAGIDTTKIKFGKNSILGEPATWNQNATSAGDESSAGDTHTQLENLAATNDNIGFVYTRDLDKITSGDGYGVHYNGEAQITIGARYAYAFAVQNGKAVSYDLGNGVKGVVRGDNDEKALTEAGAWWQGSAPTATDVVVWDVSSVSTPSSAIQLLANHGNYIADGATFAVNGIYVADAYKQMVTINGGNVSLGGAGITLAGGGLTANSAVTVRESQTWSAQNGHKLAVNGTTTISEGATLTFADDLYLTFGAITGTGNLAIGKVTFDMDLDYMLANGMGEYISSAGAGDNGFFTGNLNLVKLTGASSQITFTGDGGSIANITKAGELTSHNLELSSDKKALQLTDLQPESTVYYARRGEVEYTSTDTGENGIYNAAQVALAGSATDPAILTLSSALKDGVTIKSEGLGGTINIASGVSLAATSVNAAGAPVAITGSGTFVGKTSGTVGSVTAVDAFGTGVTLSPDWTGTVRIADTTITDGQTGIKLNELGNANSVVEFEGVQAFLNADSYTYTPNIKFSGTGLNIDAGSSNQTYTFNGDVSGDGTLKLSLSRGSNGETYVFAGDVENWTGELLAPTNGKTLTVKFTGEADTVNARISRTDGTLNLVADTNTTFNAAISGLSSLTVNANKSATFESGLTTASTTLNAGSTLSVTGSGETYNLGTVNTGTGTLDLMTSVSTGNMTVATGATLAFAGEEMLTVGGTLTLQTGSTLDLARIFATQEAPVQANLLQSVQNSNGPLAIGGNTGDSTLLSGGLFGAAAPAPGATYILATANDISLASNVNLSNIAEGYTGTLSTQDGTDGKQLILTLAVEAKNLIWDNAKNDNKWDIATTANWHASGTDTPGTSTFAQNDNVTFQSSAGTAQLQQAITAGTMTLESGANLTVDTNGNNLTVADLDTAGTTSLTKTGAGTATFGNAAGVADTLQNLTVNEGTVEFDGHVTVSNIAMKEGSDNGRTLNLDGGATVTEKVDATYGTINVGGNSSFSSLDIGQGGLSKANVVVSNGATLDLTKGFSQNTAATITLKEDGIVKLPGNVTIKALTDDGSSTVTTTTRGSYGVTNGDDVLTKVDVSFEGNVTIGNKLLESTLTVTDYNVTVNNGANTLTATTVTGGTLNVGAQNALGTGAVTVTGGTLNLGNFAHTNMDNLTVSNGGVVTTTHSDSNGSVKGTININGGGTFAVNGSNDAFGWGDTKTAKIVMEGESGEGNMATLALNQSSGTTTMATNLEMKGYSQITGAQGFNSFGGTINVSGTDNSIQKLVVRKELDLTVENGGELAIASIDKSSDQGNGVMNKLGAGTLTLGGNATVTDLNVNAGALELTSTVGSITGNLSIADGATLKLAGMDGSAVTATGTFALGNNSILDLSSLSISGTETTPITLVQGGTIDETYLSSVQVLFADGVNPESYTLSKSGNNLVLTFAQTSNDLIWDNAAGNNSWTGSNNWHTAADQGTHIAFTDGDNVQFTGSPANPSPTLGTDVSAGTMVIDTGVKVTVNTGANELTVADLDSENGSLIKNGSGTATFGGSDAEVKLSEVQVNGGTVVFNEHVHVTGNNSIQPSGNSNVTFKEGISFDGQGGGYGYAMIIKSGSSATLGGTTDVPNKYIGPEANTTLTLAEGAEVTARGVRNSVTLDKNGNVVLEDGATLITRDGGVYTPSLTLGADSSVTLGGNSQLGAVSGSGDLIVDAGTLNLGGANTGFTGNVTVNGGTIELGDNNALGTTNKTITINTDGAIDLKAHDEVCYTYTLSGGTLKNTGGNIDYNHRQTAGLVLTNDSYVSGTGNFYVLNDAYSKSSVTLNDHTLTKTGSNTVGFHTTTFDGGTLEVRDGALDFSTQHLSTFSEDITIRLADSQAGDENKLTGKVNVESGLTLDAVESSKVSLATALQNASSSVTVNVDAEKTLTMSGAVTGFGSLVKSGEGTLELTEANSHSGGTTVNGGTLVAGKQGALGSGLVTVNDGGTLQLTSTVTSINSLDVERGGTLTFAGYDDNAVSATALTLNSGSILDVSQLGLDVATGGGTITLVKGGCSSTVPSGVEVFFGDVAPDYTLSVQDNNLVLTFQKAAETLIWDNHTGNKNWSLSQDDTNWHLAGDEPGSSPFTENANVLFAAGDSTAALQQDITAGKMTVQDGADVTVVTNDHNFEAAINLSDGGSVTFDTANGSNPDTVTGTITGAGDIHKDGAGTLVLNVANTNTGTLVIDDGTVLVANVGALGNEDSRKVVVTTGSNLALNPLKSGNYTIDELTMEVGSALTFSGLDQLEIGTWNLTSDSVVDLSNITVTGYGTYKLATVTQLVPSESGIWAESRATHERDVIQFITMNGLTFDEDFKHLDNDLISLHYDGTDFVLKVAQANPGYYWIPSTQTGSSVWDMTHENWSENADLSGNPTTFVNSNTNPQSVYFMNPGTETITVGLDGESKAYVRDMVVANGDYTFISTGAEKDVHLLTEQLSNFVVRSGAKARFDNVTVSDGNFDVLHVCKNALVTFDNIETFGVFSLNNEGELRVHSEMYGIENALSHADNSGTLSILGSDSEACIFQIGQFINREGATFELAASQISPQIQGQASYGDGTIHNEGTLVLNATGYDVTGWIRNSMAVNGKGVLKTVGADASVGNYDTVEQTSMELAAMLSEFDGEVTISDFVQVNSGAEALFEGGGSLGEVRLQAGASPSDKTTLIFSPLEVKDWWFDPTGEVIDKSYEIQQVTSTGSDQEVVVRSGATANVAGVTDLENGTLTVEDRAVYNTEGNLTADKVQIAGGGKVVASDAANTTNELAANGSGTAVFELNGKAGEGTAPVLEAKKLSNEDGAALRVVNTETGTTGRVAAFNIGDADAAEPASSYQGTLQYGVGAGAASGSGMYLTIKDDNVAAGAVLEAYYDTQAPAGGSVNIIVDTENAKVAGLSDNINGPDANRAMKVYGTGEHTAEDAQNNSLEITGNGDYVYAGKLGENLNIAYTGDGSQTIEGGVDNFHGSITVNNNNPANDSILSIQNAASVNITDLTIGSNDKLEIQDGSNVGTAVVSDSVVALGGPTTGSTGTASVLNGNLTLGSGSTYDVSAAGGQGGLNLTGALTISKGAVSLSDDDWAAIGQLGWYGMYDLAFGVTGLDGLGEGIDWSQGVDATTVFANTGLRENEYYVRYSQGDMGGNGNNVGAVYIYRIPEPTTSTLSLLALAALAARRRRK